MELYYKSLILVAFLIVIHYIYKNVEFIMFIKKSNICSKNTNSIIEYEDCMGRGKLREKLEKLKKERNERKNTNK